MEIYRYLTEYNKIFNPSLEEAESSIWDMESLHKLADGSWIEQKTKDAIMLPFKILGKSTFNGNIKFTEAVYNICRNILPDESRIDAEFMNLVARHLQTKIKAKWFTDFAKRQFDAENEDERNEKANEYINGLFTGNFNMYTRLNGLKYAVMFIDQYKRLSNNRLIN
jgi:hypothetical protein